MKEYVEEWSERDTESGFTYQWNPLAKEGPTLKITKSSIGTFNFCPASYVYSYDPFGEGKRKQKTSEAMIRGTRVHDAQEKFWDEMNIEKAMNFIDDPNALVKHFREYYPQAEDEVSVAIYRAMSAWSAERFIDSVKEGTLEFYKPIANEVMLDANYILETEEHGRINVHLQGIIDRMFFDGDGYVPLELKTGAWKDSKKTNMRKEMAFYQLLFEECEAEDLIKLGIDPTYGITSWGWFFPASNYIYVEEVKSRSMTSVINSLKKLVIAYFEKEFPHKFFYKKCEKCGHYEHCDATGGVNTYDWF